MSVLQRCHVQAQAKPKKDRKKQKNAHLIADLCNIYTNDLVHKHHSPSKYLTSKVGYVGRAKETILLIKFLFIGLLSC